VALKEVVADLVHQHVEGHESAQRVAWPIDPRDLEIIRNAQHCPCVLKAGGIARGEAAAQPPRCKGQFVDQDPTRDAKPAESWQGAGAGLWQNSTARTPYAAVGPKQCKTCSTSWRPAG
jgi:hypothetical protein